MVKHKRQKPPGCIYHNKGRLWWRGRLPGETQRQAIPIKATGARYALRATPANLEVARYIVWTWWETAAQAGNNQQVKPSTVKDMVAAYLAHAQTYYRRKDNSPTGEADNIRTALRPLIEQYAQLPADMIGPDEVKAIREQMIESNLARTTINARINIIKRLYRWAADEQIIPPSTWHAVHVVKNLQVGRSGARESHKVLPIDERQVELVLPYMPPTLRVMVQLQLWTGMRSTEVCLLAPGNIDRSEDVWVYRPSQHKTEHLGHVRPVPIGPLAKSLLKPFMNRQPQEFCFTPEEAMAQRKRSREGMQPRYDRRSYYYAIRYAIDAAKRDGKKVEYWSPHRLRHTFLTNVRKHFDLETARIAGGHSNISSTEIYAERDLAKAKEVAIQMG